MQHILGTIMLMIAVILSSMFGWALIAALTDNIYWLFVAMGIGYSAIVAVLAMAECFKPVSRN